MQESRSGLYNLRAKEEWKRADMRNQISYATPLDALLDCATRLGIHENRNGMESADFHSRYLAGEFPCQDRFTAWAMDYDNFRYMQGVVAERMGNSD